MRKCRMPCSHCHCRMAMSISDACLLINLTHPHPPFHPPNLNNLEDLKMLANMAVTCLVASISTTACTIDRPRAVDITPDIFLSRYKHKCPVLLPINFAIDHSSVDIDWTRASVLTRHSRTLFSLGTNASLANGGEPEV